VERTSEQFATGDAAPPEPPERCTPHRTLSVIAHAAPDFDPGTPGTQVVAGTLIQLTGSCEEIILTADCDVTENPLPFTWSLTLQHPGGTENDVSSILVDRSTLTPHFVATDEGTYRARLRGGNSTLGMRTSLVEIDASPPPPVLLEATGTITFLRVHDLGTGFGPPYDFLDAEAVIKLDSIPDDAFGFQLRNDRNRPARQGMLDLLRDAFFHGQAVTIDYLIIPNRHNGVILRVALVG
jgi:hypothetical protein